MRGVMYGIQGHLASVDALIFEDAAEEENPEAMEKLHEEQREFEEATREL